MKKEYLFTIIAGCGMAGASVGMIGNTSGLFFSPVAESLNVGRGSTAMMLTVANFAMAIGGIYLNSIMHENTLKRVIWLASILAVGSTFLLASANSLMVLYVLSALRGLGGGMAGLVMVTVLINNWFAKNRGLYTSVALAFSGLAGVILSPVLSSIIANAGWRTGYIVLSILMLAFYAPAMFFPLAIRPRSKGMVPYGAQETTQATMTLPEEETPNVTKMTVVLVFVFAILSSFIAAFPSHLPGVGEAAGIGAAMLSASMAANVASKLLLGIMADKVGFKKSAVIFEAVVLFAVLGLMTFSASIIMLGSSFMMGFCFAIGAVGTAIVTREIFGLKKYGKIYPMVSFAGTAANAVGASIYGFMYDASGNYASCKLLTLTMAATLILTTILVYRQKTA